MSHVVLVLHVLSAGVCFDSRNQDVMGVHSCGRSRESRHQRTHEEGQIEPIDVNWPPMINRLCLANVGNGEIRERKTECMRCLKAKAQEWHPTRPIRARSTGRQSRDLAS